MAETDKHGQRSESTHSPRDDSPKPHGDKLGRDAEPVTASETGLAGDSPKRQGNKLEHAAKEATKR